MALDREQRVLELESQYALPARMARNVVDMERVVLILELKDEDEKVLSKFLDISIPTIRKVIENPEYYKAGKHVSNMACAKTREHPKSTIDKVVELYKEGKTYRKIGELTGLSYSQARNISLKPEKYYSVALDG